MKYALLVLIKNWTAAIWIHIGWFMASLGEAKYEKIIEVKPTVHKSKQYMQY